MRRFAFAFLGAAMLAGSVNSAQAVLISGDFINNARVPVMTGPFTPSAVVSGDTAILGNKQNAAGLIFTGQSGPWNALNFGNTNTNGASFTSGFLNDGTGAPTTVQLQILQSGVFFTNAQGNQVQHAAYRVGRSTVLGFDTDPNLRFEYVAINTNTAVNTAPHMNWLITGLTPLTQFDLILFGGAKEQLGNDNVNVLMSANGIAGVRDVEGDFNWSGLSNPAGQIAINIALPNPNTTGVLQSRYFGFQLQSVTAAAVVPEPATISLAALGLAGLALRRRRLA